MDGIHKRPGVPLLLSREDGDFHQFLWVFGWLIEKYILE